MKYVVAEGNAFTSNGHIYSQGEEIPEAIFSDKGYFAKMINTKKILEVKTEKPETVEEVKSETTEKVEEVKVQKKSKKSKGE